MENYGNQVGRCIVCGADRNQPCVVISGSGEEGDRSGDPRRFPHFYRVPIGKNEPEPDFTAVKDEGPYRTA